MSSREKLEELLSQGLYYLGACAQLLWFPSDKGTERRNRHAYCFCLEAGMALMKSRQGAWHRQEGIGSSEDGGLTGSEAVALTSSFGEGLSAHVKHLRDVQKSGVGMGFVEN